MQDTLANTLKSINQEQALRFYAQLDPAARARLTSQLQSLDLSLIGRLAEQYIKNKPDLTLPKSIHPVQAYPRIPATPAQKAEYDRATTIGMDLLRQGKVAAFLVAGGQGTRLGYDGPKGEYPVTPIQKKPLFQVFAEQLLSWSQQAARPIPWYVMTSDVNDAPTRAFFEKHNFFNYNPAYVRFFQQGMMPAFSYDGQLLLAEKDSLALSPDGHGGSLRALHKSGALADMQKRGIEHLSYFQVDNPLVHCIDPLFLGLHHLTHSEMSSKTIPKSGPLEKVGNFCIADNTLQVIEYSDMPEDLARATNPDGSLKFNAGSIAIHALKVSFIERLNAGNQLKLPWHRAEKKVPTVDLQGHPIKPDKPNAIKLEQFVFDAIPLAHNPIVYTTDRAEEFSPVKNAAGADSPESCRQDQIKRAARWLEAQNVHVPPTATVEISPLFAATEQQLHDRHPQITIKSGESLYLADDE